MATLAPGAYGPPIPTGPTTPQKPFAQQLEENYFAGSKPSQDERAGFRNFLSLVQSSGKSNQQIEAEFQGLKNIGMDFAETLGNDYYQNKLYQQLTNQRENLGTDKYYKGSIDAMGGIDTATQYMASLLTRSGIRDLNEIGERVEKVPQYAPKTNHYTTNDDLQRFDNLIASGRYGQEFVPTDTESGAGYYRPAKPPAGEMVDVDGKNYFVQYGEQNMGDVNYTYGYLVPAEQTGTQVTTKLINKRTGEQLKQGHDASYIYSNTQNSYLDGEQADSDYVIGGSFAGGNTSLRVSMVNGNPVFYSTPGPSSSDISPEMLAAGVGIASLMFPGVGQAIGSAIAGAVGVTVTPAVAGAIGTFVIQTAVNEGDVQKGLISAAMAYAGAELFGGQDAAITTGDLQGAAAAGLTPEQVTDFLSDPTLGGTIGGDLSVGASDAFAQLNNIPDLAANLEVGLSEIADLSGNAAFVAADAIEPIFAASDFAGPALSGAPQGIQGLPSADAFQSPPYNFQATATPGFDFQAGQGFPAAGGLQGADPFAIPDVSFAPEYLENPLELGRTQNLQAAPYVLSPAEIDNVVANLGNGTVMVSDPVGNLSVVPADGLDFVDDIDNLAAVSTDVLQPGTPPTGVDAAIGDLGLDDLTLDDLAKDLGADSVPINREVTLDAELPDANATGTIDADGVKISREVTLDADRPLDAGTKVTDPIDADGVSITREVTLDPDRPFDAGTKVTEPIDADGVRIDRSNVYDPNRPYDPGTPAAGAGDNDPFGGDLPGDGTFTQEFPDGSTLTVRADGTITATDATEGLFGDGTGGGAGAGDLGDGGGFGVRDDYGVGDAGGGGDGASSVNDPLGGDMPPVDGLRVNDPLGGDLPPVDALGVNDPLGGDLPPVDTRGGNDPLGGDMPPVDGLGVNDPLGGDLPPGDGAPIEDRTTLYEAVKDKPLSESLKDLGEGALEFATSNPLLTAGVLLGGTALLGGDEEPKEVDPEPPPKKTYTYGAAPERDTSTLTPTFNAASQIYGPQEAYKPPVATVPEDYSREFGALLSGQTPGSQGLRYLAKTLGAPQTVDINKLTPNQLAILQQMVGVA